MTKRCNRNLVAVCSPLSIGVGMYWSEVEEGVGYVYRNKFLYYPNGVVVESVKKSIQVLMRNGSTISREEDMTAEQWIKFDQNPDLFDLIADAEEPEQAFVSRYVLEG